MSSHKLFPIPLVLVTAAAIFACAPADGGGESAEEAEMAETAADAAANTNPRFGVWQIETDQPPPYRNIMTYEPYGDGGMKITVAATNSEGVTTEWGYVTMFDGVFRTVEGRDNAETAVEVVDERTNRILNARNGEVTQVIINVLSEDGNTIDNEYRSTSADGTERVSHAVYRRIEG